MVGFQCGRGLRPLGWNGGLFTRPTEGVLTMRNHGQEPKDKFVRAYVSWWHGRLRRTRSYVRSMTHKLGVRTSALQLDFGFGRRARPTPASDEYPP
jgi:hypothetical protein